MAEKRVTQTIAYVGVNDHLTANFENQYPIPQGISYNSYIIFDEKITLMDSVDGSFTAEWLANVERTLEGKTPHYLVVLHMEPDHAASIVAAMERYPEMKVVGNSRTFQMIENFYHNSFAERRTEVKDGEELSSGSHTLKFIFAPMIHWPEVMVAYELSEKVLFSADAFGKFGALDVEEEWESEARRYYYNIVGKYGANVQTLLKKAAALEIEKICGLHGPVLSENLGYYIGKYQQWSTYEAEEQGVAIVVASIYGNTLSAARELEKALTANGTKCTLIDITKQDPSYALAECFRYDKAVFAAATYDAALFPVMDFMMMRLSSKNYQNRKVALIENGSWAPMAAKLLRGKLEGMKAIEIVEPVVAIRSSMNEKNREEIKALAEVLK